MAPTLPARTDDGAARREALARRLVELRETAFGRPVKGLALASAVGTSKHSLWEWEHGRHIPREQALDALACFFAQGDSDAAEAFRSELLGLRAEALRELQNESAQRPPGHRRKAAAKGRPAHLSTLDPQLIREYARLFRIGYLQACDELFAALATGNGHQPVGRRDLKPSPLTGREVLAAYYSDDSLGRGGLAPYEVEINGRRVRLALATRPAWSGICVPLAALGGLSPHERCALTTTVAPDRAIDSFRALALRFLCDVEARGLEIYDAPIFRLRQLDLRRGGLDATFSPDSFLRYRLSVGLLGDELTAALAQASSIDELLDASDERMPLRAQVLPDGAGLADFDNRVCSGGVLTLLAIARPKPHNDFVVLAQRRGAAVSDSQGLLSVIPRAFHQPSVLPHSRALASEVPPSATLYRELFEEVLGGREVEVDDRDLEPMWFVDESKPLRWLRERPDSYQALCVGLGVNLFSGNYEIGTLLVIHDPKFWRAFEQAFRPNWEVANLIRCSTLPGPNASPRRGLSGLIRAADVWTSEGLMVLVEGLAYLKRHFPERVCLPAIRARRLAPTPAELL
jgi:transcriptional regulator with XRE-family HTH domain